MPRRRLIWWIFIPVLTVIVAGVAVLFASTWLKAGRTIDQQRLVVPARFAALKAERVIRPVVFEPAEEGNGMDLLIPALAGIATLREEELMGFPSFSADEVITADPERIESVIAQIRPHTDQLKQALRRAWVEPPYNYGDLLGQQLPWLAHSIMTSRILHDAALHHMVRGRRDEAIELILTTLGIADRIKVKGFVVQELVGVVVRSQAQAALKSVLAAHDLTAADIGRLAKALSELDPKPESDARWLEREDLFFRHVVLNVIDRPERGGVDSTMVKSARHFFSLRIAIAESFEEQDRYMRGVNAATALPLGERGAAARRLSAEFERITIMHGLLQPQIGRAWENVASAAMDHRLARVSVALAQHHAETGDYPATLGSLVPKYLAAVPVDAFSGLPFHYSRVDGGARVASQTHSPDFVEGIATTGEPYNADGFHEWRIRRR